MREILIFILIFLPFLCNPFDLDPFFELKNMILVLLSVSLCLMILVKRKNIDYKNLIFKNRFLILYLIFVFISCIMSENVTDALYGSFMRYEGFVTIFAYAVLIVVASNFFKLDKKTIKYICVASCLMPILGLFQKFGLGEKFFTDLAFLSNENNGLYFASGTFRNRNFLGSYLVLMIPFNIYMLFKTKKYFYNISLGLTYICLLATNTRGAWLGFLAQLIIIFIYFIKFRKDKLNEYFKMILFLLFCTLIYDILFDFLFIKRFLSIFIDVGNLVNKKDVMTAGSGRIAIWFKTPDLFMQHPFFGCGLENLQDITSLGMPFDRMHNEFLHVLITSGLFAFVCYFVFVTSKYLTMFKNFFKTHNELQLLIIVCCIGYLTQSMLNISVPGVASIYWILLGLTNIDYEI